MNNLLVLGYSPIKKPRQQSTQASCAMRHRKKSGNFARRSWIRRRLQRKRRRWYWTKSSPMLGPILLRKDFMLIPGYPTTAREHLWKALRCVATTAGKNCCSTWSRKRPMLFQMHALCAQTFSRQLGSRWKSSRRQLKMDPRWRI